jgi:FkbM family methyltransferase
LFFRPASSDGRVIEQIFHDNCYDLARLQRFGHLMEFLARSRKSGKRPLIVDAGANIGASSLFFAMKFPEALVAAIEPALGNYQLLVENVKGLGVIPVHGAISSTTDRVRVVDVGEGFWGYQTQPAGQDEQGIRAVTLQQLYETHSLECFPFIVKVDIEGGEKDLFSANVDWVRNTPLIIVELHDWLLPRQGSARPFLECIARLDRDFVYIGENVYSIANDLERWTASGSASIADGCGNMTMRGESGATGEMPAEREDDRVTSISHHDSLEEEPFADEVVAAMKDFATNVAALRSADAELRATLAAVQADGEQTRQLLASTRADLQRAERALADSRRDLASSRQELSDYEAREKALIGELSAAITSLQQLRDQLDERDGSLAQTQEELANIQEELERRKASDNRKLAAEAASRQKLELKLRKRSEELTAFRQRRLVRVALKIGNWLHRRPMSPTS